MKLTKKTINISLICLLSVVFITLMVIGTLKDFEIAKFLSGSFISSGNRYSTNFFPVVGEAIGQLPIFIFGSLAALFLFDYFISKEEKKFKFLGYCFLIVAFGVFTYCTYDISKRSVAVLNLGTKKIILYAISGVVGLLATAISYYYLKDNPIKDKNKTFKFAITTIAVCVIFLVIEVIKLPVARMRYRAMNVINDYSYYTKWFEFSKAKASLQELINNGTLIKDDFTSFPSGHTFSASTSYLMILLPTLYEKFNTRNWKITCIAVPTIWTLFVGLSRMCAGAHYLTDVTFALFAGVGSVFLFRYIFITRKKMVTND